MEGILRAEGTESHVATEKLHNQSVTRKSRERVGSNVKGEGFIMKPWRTIHNQRLAYDATEEPVLFLRYGTRRATRV